LLHLAGSQPMLKCSYKAEASVIISIPHLVGGVADVVVEIKGWSISITFRFSVGLQTPDDLSRSRLGFIEKIGVESISIAFRFSVGLQTPDDLSRSRLGFIEKMGEPSYNQNYDDNYYPHESLIYPCCDYSGGSHETFQCQPDNQNVDFSGSDQIQTPQYPDVNHSSPEISNEEIFQAKRDLMKSIQTFLERFNCIPFEEKPQILFQTWETFFAIQCSQPEDSNELFQKLLEDLKELAEYDQSTKVPEQQKQKMEDTMFDLVKMCHHKQFLCIHDDEQEVKNVKEQQAGRRNRAEKSLQNFRVVHKKPEHLFSMGYEHLSITPETKSDEVTESNAENLLPIPSKCEVTLEDEIECDMPAKDVCSPVLTKFSNPLFKDNDNFDSSDDESLPAEDIPAEEFKIYSNPLCDEDEINSDKLDPHCFNVESDFVESLLNHDTFIDFFSKFDFSGELAHIKPEIPKSDFDFEEEIRLIENLLYDISFPRPLKELNAEIVDTIIEPIPLLPIPVQDGNFQQEEIDIVTEMDDVLPSIDDNDDDYDLLLGEADL
nr:hypothetical protein [Tanacetum cinerariifolium]